MALSFNPPQDLINAYLSRPSPGQIASQGIGDALKTYAAEKDAQQKEALAQQAKDIEMAKGLAGNGQDFMDAYNKIVAQRTPQPNAQATPTTSTPWLGARLAKHFFGNKPVGQAPTDTGLGDASTPPTPSTGTVSGVMPPGYLPLDPAGTPAPMTTTPQTDPLVQEYQKDPLAFKKQHGSAGIAKLKTQAEIDKLLQDKNTSKVPTSLEQILAQKVANGEMTLDEAMQKKAQGMGLSTEATTTAKNKVTLEKEKPKAEASLTNTEREYENMIKQAEAIKNDPSLDMATGATGIVASKVPSTGAKRVAANLETLKAKTLLSVLASLKELSSTGASGFGQLSNVEGENLRNSITSLDRTMSTKDFSASLDRFINELRQRKAVLRDTFNKTYSEGTGASSHPQNSGLVHLSTKELMDLRKKMTAHQSNGL